MTEPDGGQNPPRDPFQQGGGVAPQGGAAAPAAPTTRLPPKARRFLIGGGIAVSGIFVLIVGLAIAFNHISSTEFAPEKPVEAYLGALQDGDAATAMALSAPNVRIAEQALLTNAITGAAEDRISGYEITDSEKHGDAAWVTAEITQDGVTSTHSYKVEVSGRTALGFPEWTLGRTDYMSITVLIPEGTSSVLVNEQEVLVEDLALVNGRASAVVLPGQYTVALPQTSDFLASEPVLLYVPAHS